MGRFCHVPRFSAVSYFPCHCATSDRTKRAPLHAGRLIERSRPHRTRRIDRPTDERTRTLSHTHPIRAAFDLIHRDHRLFLNRRPMTANGHAANGADAPSKMPHKPWRDDEEDANSLRAIVRANFPRSVDDAFPFLRVARTMTRDDLKNDLVAGLTVAVMVIPQGMAYAALASLRPEIGLYSCILPILTYALVGSSRQLAVGPVAMVALLTTAGLSPIQDPLEDPDRYQRLASTLAFLVGIMQAGMGLLRLEFIARFLPHPVLSGFTSAAAVVIGSSQIKDGEFFFTFVWAMLLMRRRVLFNTYSVQDQNRTKRTVPGDHGRLRAQRPRHARAHIRRRGDLDRLPPRGEARQATVQVHQNAPRGARVGEFLFIFTCVWAT